MSEFDYILRIANLFKKIATDRDYKDLIKINLSKLRETEPMPPNMEAREYYQQLGERAKEGPIFDAHTLGWIQQLREDQLPRENKKQFIRWIADVANKKKDAPLNNDLQYMIDYLNGANDPVDYTQYDNWEELYNASHEWHQTEFYNKEEEYHGDYKTNDVVYSFPNGYKIVSIKDPDDLKVEGEYMQHCVGKFYCDYVSEGEGNIYSLRDPNNKPHVTIRTRTYVDDYGDNVEEVYEIKGKQNEVPVEKYQQMIRTWLEKSFSPYRYMLSEDYLNMTGKQDLPDLINFAVEMPELDRYIFLMRTIFRLVKNYGIPQNSEQKFFKILQIYTDTASSDHISYSINDAKNIIGIIKVLSPELANKIKKKIMWWDAHSATNSDDEPWLFTEEFDDVDGIDEFRKEYIKYLSKTFPYKLVSSMIELNKNEWKDSFLPAFKAVQNGLENGAYVENYGHPTTYDAALAWLNVPKKLRFSSELSKDADRIINLLTEYPFKYADIFSKIFIFKGSKIGDKARPFAEALYDNANNANDATYVNRQAIIRNYFEKGYQNISEINDITQKMAKLLAIHSPMDFFLLNLDKDKRFHSSIKDAQNMISNTLNNLSPNLLVAMFEKALHLYRANKKTWPVNVLDVDHYPSPSHYLDIIEKTIDYMLENIDIIGDPDLRLPAELHGYSGDTLQKDVDDLKEIAFKNLEKARQK